MSEDNRSIGEILKIARQEKGLTLDEIAALTKVRPKYLAAIEGDHFEVLPSLVQIKGFVRAFARAVELDPTPLLTRLRTLHGTEDLSDPEELEPAETAPVAEPPRLLGEIGSIIKAQRKKLGISISSVESQIYIPDRYLTAIENGNLEQLPSTVQGKGMVKNYAQFLGLDPDPLLSNYAEILQDRLRETREAGQTPPKAPSSTLASIRRFLASPTILWVGVVLLISVVTIWSGWLIFSGRSGDPASSPTIPGVADMLLPSPTFTPTQEVEQATPGEIEIDIAETSAPDAADAGPIQATPTPGLTGNEKVQVQLIIVQRAWVRVTVDNIIQFEGRLIPGSVKLFGGELSIEILTGNAGGVEVIYNQQVLGAMGLYGEAVDRVYTAQGIATPTPTISPTPVPSSTPSLTPSPTATPVSDS